MSGQATTPVGASEPNYVRPRDLAEALAVRAAHPSYLVLAGGTDVLVDAHHKTPPAGMLDLWQCAALRGISATASGVRIGAATTWLEIANDATLTSTWTPLTAAAREIGARQIQARGTIGGNIGTSSPVGDSLPVLLALEARIEVASVRGTRVLPYDGYCTGYRQTQLAADELVIAIHLPPPPDGAQLYWRKVGTRQAQSISKVMAAAVLVCAGDTITFARLALGAVADRPIRLHALEQGILGKTRTAGASYVQQAVLDGIAPITDVRSTEAYRRRVAAQVLARFVAGAPDGACERAG